jgi:hypothetical protein
MISLYGTLIHVVTSSSILAVIVCRFRRAEDVA